MSTVLFAASPGQNIEKIQTSGISVGSGMQTANSVELQINQATTVVNDNGTTRQIKAEEVLLLLNEFMQIIVRGNWPYAAS